MLKLGGENVSPEEIEICLREMPEVGDALVVGVPDRRKGELPYAYVTPRGGEVLTEEMVLEWARTRLAMFKVPAFVRVLDEFAKLGNNKVDRVSMATAAVAEVTSLAESAEQSSKD